MTIERHLPQSAPVESDGLYGVAQEVFEHIRGTEKGKKKSPYFALRVTEKFVCAVLQVEPLREHLSDQQLAEIAGTNPYVIQRLKDKALKKWSNGHA